MIGESRDALDRHYTPKRLAEIIVAETGSRNFAPRLIVEPSVGGGSIARACKARWPDAMLIGVDLDPDAAGGEDCDLFVAGDWLVVARDIEEMHRVDLVIGNPPFTGARGIAHVNTSREVAPLVSMILPWEFFGGVQRWQGQMTGEHAPMSARPIHPRPWSAKVRGTALYQWSSHHRPETPRTEPLPRWKP